MNFRMSTRLGRLFSVTSRVSYSTRKRFLQINGQDSKTFLQGLCTNDTSKLCKNGDFLSAVFLNTKGRIIADSTIHEISNSESTAVLLETPSSVFDDLFKHLSMYKLRSKIQMTEIKESNSLFPHTKSVIVSSNDESNSDTYRYVRSRYLRGLAEGAELRNRIPLEMNLDLLNYISFTKGCYIGQELIARTHFKGQIRKRVVPFIQNITSKEIQQPFTFKKYDLEAVKAIEESDIDSSASSTAVNQYPLIPVGSKVRVLRGTDPSGVTGAVTAGESPGVSGEVIAYEPSIGLGLALLRLDDVLLSSSSSPVRTFFADTHASDGQVCDGSSTDITPVDSASWVPISPFQPFWWPEIDPSTGKVRAD